MLRVSCLWRGIIFGTETLKVRTMTILSSKNISKKESGTERMKVSNNYLNKVISLDSDPAVTQ